MVNNYPSGAPSASIVAIGADGRVRAMMGGRDFNVSELNLAMGAKGGGSGRQPGSSFKPFALAEAFAQGYSAEARLPAPSCVSLDIPARRTGTSAAAGPAAATPCSARIQASSNVVFAQLMLELGPENVIEMAHTPGRRVRAARWSPRSSSAPARCRCWTWPAPTRASGTTACTTSR